MQFNARIALLVAVTALATACAACLTLRERRLA
jgi:hypothetical protein